MKLSKTNPYHIYHWDAFDFVKTLNDNSVDMVFTSPPYFMWKDYDKSKNYEDFLKEHIDLFPEIFRITKDGWSICWQIGYHVKDNSIMPLDWLVYDAIKDYIKEKKLILRNRINWQFWHGLHASKRFSGRHEVVLWFTKGNEYQFDLDTVRVPQKYPGKRYFKGDKKWEFSGNPLWKNPSDVWDIPNVKANHIEKTDHQCQFPVALVQRFIKAVVPKGGVIFDPFMWSGSAGVAALLENRFFIGSEQKEEYCIIAKDRCAKTLTGEIQYREDVPIYEPVWNLSVARKPESFMY